MTIKNLKINERVFDIIDNGYTFVDKNKKKILSTVGGIAVIASIAGTIMTAGVVDNFNRKQYVEDQPIIQEYNEKLLTGVRDTEFVNEFKESEQRVENLYKYIDLSEELHDLHLNSYEEVVSFGMKIDELPTPEVVEQKIAEFKELKKAKDNNLNSKAYELREIEKLVNKEILQGYNSIINYGQMHADLMIASANDLQHSDVKVYVYEAGEVAAAINGNYDAKETKKIEGYLNVVNKVYQYSNGNSGSKDNGYNHDRNEVLSNSIEILAANGIKYIEDNGLNISTTKIANK